MIDQLDDPGAERFGLDKLETRLARLVEDALSSSQDDWID